MMPTSRRRHSPDKRLHRAHEPQSRLANMRDKRHRNRGLILGGSATILTILFLAHQWLDFVPYVFLGVASLELTGWGALPDGLLSVIGLVSLAALFIALIEWLHTRAQRRRQLP